MKKKKKKKKKLVHTQKVMTQKVSSLLYYIKHPLDQIKDVLILNALSFDDICQILQTVINRFAFDSTLMMKNH